ncbi:MAG: hypothetical protein QMD53_06360 [Actinomycetota bacterium]|nr:hypothetical protein [Actinomycetota bacterium]
MKVVDSKKHESYEDSLYQCICGATHLEIKHLDFIEYLGMNSLKESKLALEK